MATYRRFHIPGASWFFTLATEGRQPLLTRPEVLRAMAQALAEVRQREYFALLGWVVLPDHLHVVVRLPAGDAAYARRISTFKRLVSQRVAPHLALCKRVSHHRRRECGLWQRRFWDHLIRNEADLQRHLDYMHYNPVKHGHARCALTWPYSSFRSYVRAGTLSPDWAAAPKHGTGADVAGFGE